MEVARQPSGARAENGHRAEIWGELSFEDFCGAVDLRRAPGPIAKDVFVTFERPRKLGVFWPRRKEKVHLRDQRTQERQGFRFLFFETFDEPIETALRRGQ